MQWFGYLILLAICMIWYRIEKGGDSQPRPTRLRRRLLGHVIKTPFGD
jgi:hypothetical protein